MSDPVASDVMHPTAAAASAAGDRYSGAKLSLRDSGIIVSFLALFVALSVTTDAFLTSQNLLNILEQWAPIGIIACAGTIVIIGGGFDLSVAAIFALTGVVAAEAAQSMGAVPALLIGLALGCALGLANGLIVNVARINSFIATLATGIIIRGIAVAATGGFLVTVDTPGFSTLGRDDLGPVKLSIVIFAVFVAVCWFVMTKTAFGRYVYAVGGNADAARLSGVRVGGIKTATFVLSGFAASLAGLIVASRAATGQADAGIGLELTAIAAVVIGGTSIMGGDGAIWRTILGVGIIALMGNGFTLLNVDPTYQQIAQGGIILIAVAVDVWARGRPR